MKVALRPAQALIALLAASPARACLWDDDTLATEARGLPDAVAVLTGRFERNPPRYCELRLRAAEERIRRAGQTTESLPDLSPPRRPTA
jgi:hypothetical protein